MEMGGEGHLRRPEGAEAGHCLHVCSRTVEGKDGTSVARHVRPFLAHLKNTCSCVGTRACVCGYPKRRAFPRSGHTQGCRLQVLGHPEPVLKLRRRQIYSPWRRPTMFQDDGVYSSTFLLKRLRLGSAAAPAAEPHSSSSASSSAAQCRGSILASC